MPPRTLGWHTAALVIAVLLAGPVGVLGQAGSGSLTGIVRDQAGATAAGATISIASPDTDSLRVVVSSSAGVFTAANLPPGVYRVDVQLDGFRTVHRDA